MYNFAAFMRARTPPNGLPHTSNPVFMAKTGKAISGLFSDALLLQIAITRNEFVQHWTHFVLIRPIH